MARSVFEMKREKESEKAGERERERKNHNERTSKTRFILLLRALVIIRYAITR